MSASITVLLVDKSGSLKSLSIKDFKEEELYKKCGFKVATHFEKQHTWVTKIEGLRYNVSVYGKTDGKANTENKYDFPPPLDNVLLFGTCVIVGAKIVDVSSEAAMKEASSSKDFVFTVELWNKIYEKLFGGFEDLNATAAEDDEEEDELELIDAGKKTKQGYLKDGFVVDSEEEEEEEAEYESDFDEEEDGSHQEDENDELPELADIGSELSEEPYI